VLVAIDGATPFGEMVYQGWLITELHHFDKPTAAILQNLCNEIPQRQMAKHPIDYKVLMKWDKKSGPNGLQHRHLAAI